MSYSVEIASSISIFFIFLSVIMPNVNQEFGFDNVDANLNEITGELEDEKNQLTIWSYAFSFFKVFFWSFGAIPLWFESLFFLPLRIMLMYALVDLIWLG